MKRYYFGTNPLGPSKKVKSAIRKAAKDINTLPQESQARLERLFQSKYGINNNNILFANSLKELCYVICRCFQPRKILIVDPALNIYREVAGETGALVVSLSGSEDNFFFPNLLELIEMAEKCDLVFIANPNRITGKALPDSVLTEVISALTLKDSITVIDESLIEFTGGEGFMRKASKSMNVIVLRTTSFYFGLPGLELACAVAGSQIIESLQRHLYSIPSIPAMEAARTALKDKTYRRLSELFLKEEKRHLFKAISRIPEIVMHDSDTNTFLLNAADHASEIAHKATKAGLAVEGCSDIEGINDSFLRLSVMRHDHNLKLIKLLNEIRKSVETE